MSNLCVCFPGGWSSFVRSQQERIERRLHGPKEREPSRIQLRTVPVQIMRTAARRFAFEMQTLALAGGKIFNSHPSWRTSKTQEEFTGNAGHKRRQVRQPMHPSEGGWLTHALSTDLRAGSLLGTWRLAVVPCTSGTPGGGRRWDKRDRGRGGEGREMSSGIEWHRGRPRDLPHTCPLFQRMASVFVSGNTLSVGRSILPSLKTPISRSQLGSRDA